MKKVTKIAETASSKVKLKKIRVAAYCRVSTDSDAQLESLEAQKTHYENYITSRDDWEFAGLYYDEGITGTKKDKRPELLRLIDDCKAGKVDFVITKSISRFSRNTTDCLELVRKLLALHIPIYFEKENINTGSMESELFLAILSSMAEGESVSISENNKWSIQKRFESGTYKVSYPPYGYDWDGEQMVINPEQAAVVKEIFAALLSGKGTHAIADDLNRRGIPTKRNGRWTATTIRGMLSNEKYVGDCLFQKTYSDSRFVRHNNHGEQTQYMVKDHHEAIISREDFEAAHAFIHQRATEKGVVKGSDKYQNRYTFSGKIICGECGDTFKRRIHSCTGYKYTAWCCSTHIKDKDKCHMLFVKDDDLKQAFVTMMNKLVYAHRIILKPYVDALKNTSSDDSLRRIQEIQTLLAQNTEKRETLTKLMTQGIIDPILFNKETNELLSQADSFRDEINALKNAVSGDVTKVTAATALLHFTEKGGILQEFDDDLFNEYVNRIIVRSRNEVRFELKCGLTDTSGKDVNTWDIHPTATALKTAAPRLKRMMLKRYESSMRITSPGWLWPRLLPLLALKPTTARQSA